MDIIPIFHIENQSLYAIRYPGDDTDVFDQLFDDWQNVEYLENFFTNNERDLKSGFFGKISVNQAVLQTINDAKEFQKQLLQIATGENSRTINSYFKPLDKITYKPEDYDKRKSKGIFERSWIRLYAIKAPDEECYIITGGTIKLTRSMQERTHTHKELKKLNRVIDYLHSQGIVDNEGIKDISK